MAIAYSATTVLPALQKRDSASASAEKRGRTERRNDDRAEGKSEKEARRKKRRRPRTRHRVNNTNQFVDSTRWPAQKSAKPLKHDSIKHAKTEAEVLFLNSHTDTQIHRHTD